MMRWMNGPSHHARLPGATSRLVAAGLLLVVLLAATWLRLQHPSAGAPAELCRGSLAIYTDEGFKTYHARNLALYGRWLWHPQDQYRFWLHHAPASRWAHALWFTAFGDAGIPTARALHLLASLLALALWALTAWRELGPRRAILATVLGGSSFVGGMYGRMVFQENLLNLGLALAVWALARRRPRVWHLVLGAASIVAASLVKSLATLFVVSAAVGALAWLWRRYLLRLPEDAGLVADKLARGLRVALVAVVTGYLIVWAVPGLVSWLPLSGRSPVAGPLGILRALGYLQFAAAQPFVFTLGLWGALALVATGLGRARRVARSPDETAGGPLLAVCAGALLVGLPGLSLFAGSPDRIRYALPLLPAVHLLAAHLVWRQLALEGTEAPGQPGRPSTPLRWVVLAVVVALHLATHLFFRFVSPVQVLQTLRAVAAGELVAAAQMLAVAACALFVGGRALFLWRRGNRAGLALALLAGCLVLAGGRWGEWLHRPPMELAEARADMARRLPEGAVLAGQWAPTLVLDGNLRALHLHYTFNLPNHHLCALRPTHLVLYEGRPEENDILARDYPGWASPSALLRRYSVAGHHLSLYAVPPDAMQTTCAQHARPSTP